MPCGKNTDVRPDSTAASGEPDTMPCVTSTPASERCASRWMSR